MKEGRIRRVLVLTLVNTLNRLQPDPDKKAHPQVTAAFLSSDTVLVSKALATTIAIAAMLGLNPGPDGASALAWEHVVPIRRPVINTAFCHPRRRVTTGGK